MSTLVVVGAQWGDEGKGKITDYLARQADVVVRHQGGNNAGHTVVVGETEYKLHLIPSGILYPGKLCVIGNGVVLDPKVFLEELDYLRGMGVDTGGLRISARTHLIMPYHRLLDGLEEEQRGDGKIGTTRRGIGPAYMDKYARVGIRVIDLLEGDFERKLARVLAEKNRLLERIYGVPGLIFADVLAEYQGYARALREYMVDADILLWERIVAGENVLFEGAQGVMLDIDHGTYPYVTSSHPVAGGACIGAGVGPTRINRVLGVAKAYTSRVGDGPFPTELLDGTGDWIRERGGEYGTTTGRPRRCGWLDVPVLRHAARVSGLTGLAITRLDTLGGLATVKLGVGYKDGNSGQVRPEFPSSLRVLEGCQSVFEEMEGWPGELGGARTFDDLPATARRYVERIEELVGVKAVILSVGREREDTIVREPQY